MRKHSLQLCTCVAIVALITTELHMDKDKVVTRDDNSNGDQPVVHVPWPAAGTTLIVSCLCTMYMLLMIALVTHTNYAKLV